MSDYVLSLPLAYVFAGEVYKGYSRLPPQHFATLGVFTIGNFAVHAAWEYSKKNYQLHTFLRNNFVSSSTNVSYGRWWTLFTSSLSHPHIRYLLSNMSTLWSVAPFLVKTIGMKYFVGLFLAGSLGCNFVTLFYNNVIAKRIHYDPILGDVGNSGASGALCALSSFSCLIQQKLFGSIFPLSFHTPFWELDQLFHKMIIPDFLFPLVPFWVNEVIFAGLELFYMQLEEEGVIKTKVNRIGHIAGQVTGLVFGALFLRYRTDFFPKRMFQFIPIKNTLF
eukprot:TRINITY_DN1817_c0_g1_i1.p1 TRINITY_DN1817_c0_g1~~TRINITY_DN1817_c0_g1_i1.p1  ORF type:complete len:278 (+),score=36.03 TRINITY_DN1817_c0_g1_i1:120-953(+)